MLALVGATLYVLDIRDARCYASAFVWVPTISGVLLGNISIPLAFALAILWRYRDPVRPPAVALGLAVVRQAALLADVRLDARDAPAPDGRARGRDRRRGDVGAWAIIGFAGLAEYPDLLRAALRDPVGAQLLDRRYGRDARARRRGRSRRDAHRRWRAARRLRRACARREDEERSFTCAVAATLALSPIVWLHYLVVLLVPLAILRPRFSLLWLLPVLLWVSPRPATRRATRRSCPGSRRPILVAVLLRAADVPPAAQCWRLTSGPAPRAAAGDYCSTL